MGWQVSLFRSLSLGAWDGIDAPHHGFRRPSNTASVVSQRSIGSWVRGVGVWHADLVQLQLRLRPSRECADAVRGGLETCPSSACTCNLGTFHDQRTWLTDYLYKYLLQ